MAGKMDNPQPSPFIPMEEIDPTKFSFASTVRAESVTPEILAALTPQVSTYRDFAELPGMDNSRVEEDAGGGKILGDDWIYSHHRSAGSLYQFIFVCARSNVDRQTPVTALSYVTSDIHPWPDVLLYLRFIEDLDMPLEVATAPGVVEYLPRLRRRLSMIEGNSYPTLIRVKVFVSHAPFPEGFSKLDPPITGSVWWDMRNQNGSLNACLHPYIEFPESIKRGRTQFNAGTTKTPGGEFGQKTEFPATNHRDWRDHVYYEHVQQVNGLWMLEQREAVVPRGRRRIKNAT